MTLIGIDGVLTERQFLQRSPCSLGEEEPDEANLERKPAAVADQEFPADVLQADGVDEGSEEAGATAEELED